MNRIEVHELPDRGDRRGRSHTVDIAWFAEGFTVRDGHVTTVLPGHVRGNHLHEQNYEILIVVHEGPWSLHHQIEPDGDAIVRSFDGTGTVALCVPPGLAHAVRNDGTTAITVLGLTDNPYDPAHPDAVASEMTPPS